MDSGLTKIDMISMLMYLFIQIKEAQAEKTCAT